ncbi:MAG: flagellar protein FlaI [Kordiimonas sp.]|nr:flagellar protein FlaI [Kordiimonas sp.]|tara:strand:- start:1061 stop:2863 length:1803 start_codon:yes stop_codon:yes gene_type:complete
MKPAAFGRRTGTTGRGGPRRASGGFGRQNLKPGTEETTATTSSTPAKPSKKPQPAPAASASNASAVDRAYDLIEPLLAEHFDLATVADIPKSDISESLGTLISETATQHNLDLNDLEVRDLVTVLLNDLLEEKVPEALAAAEQSNSDAEQDNVVDLKQEDDLIAQRQAATVQNNEQKQKASQESVNEAKEKLQPLLLEYIDATAANEMDRSELAEQVSEAISELMVQEKINLNLREQRELVNMLLHDMLGLGPLEPLLEDESITDIMVNGPKQVYIEKNGKLTLSDIHFRDNQHLLNICTRIVSYVGRRVDESSPICDARLADGSRVNIIIPPLAIDGPSISIRKFAKQKITLDKMLDYGSVSHKMATVLKIAGAARLNIVISGGTGSGKTTMLNALSRMVDQGERVVTIEDAAELQLQQPHVVRLETRPSNLEGKGEISMRDLVKNALRMRPDRIILGEVRGPEMVDVLQAMNTGHDGSMCTLHANNPREALNRMENMVGMADLNLPSHAVKTQISGSVDLIVQVSRMRDGKRRCQAITEVVGMEGDVITTQDLFTYVFTGEDAEGNLTGEFRSTGVRPYFMDKATYFGLDRALMEAMA